MADPAGIRLRERCERGVAAEAWLIGLQCGDDCQEWSMLSVLRVHLPSDIPIVGCELTPYVLLRRPDKTVTTDDVPEAAPLDGHFLRYKWLVLLVYHSSPPFFFSFSEFSIGFFPTQHCWFLFVT